MRRLLISCCAVLFLPSIANASDIWRGEAVITSKSGVCDAYNPVGNIHAVRYLPRTANNGPDSVFAFFQNNAYGESFELTNGEFGSTAKAVRYGSLWATNDIIPANSTNPPAVKVAFTTVARTPVSATTSPSTTFIEVTGTIYNYDRFTFTNGCNANFRMALTRQSP